MYSLGLWRCSYDSSFVVKIVNYIDFKMFTKPFEPGINSIWPLIHIVEFDLLKFCLKIWHLQSLDLLLIQYSFPIYFYLLA